MERHREDTLLDSSFRVLDLADEKGFLCGKILGDLGADVIKIEKPGGDPARNLGPFYHDDPDSQKSLYWFAYNANKRGITLNIEIADGREIFKKLARTTDVVVESFPPGYMERLGLGYSTLKEINPGLIMTSITPFGQTGRRKDHKTSDIVSMAMGVMLFSTGEPDRPPLRVSLPQAYLHAGAEAAVATMIAHYYKELTGKGQHVDVSIQESTILLMTNAIPHWEMSKRILHRVGVGRGGTASHAVTRQLWPCKDGYVSFVLMGTMAGQKTASRLTEWMKSEGMADYLSDFDWLTYDRAKTTQDEQDYLEQPIAKFFMTRTRAELYDEAVKRHFMLYPLASSEDLLQNNQLRARSFWVDIEHPELGTRITYPGGFIKSSETVVRIRRRAPLIGEHNREVYCEEMGFTESELILLKQAGVI